MMPQLQREQPVSTTAVTVPQWSLATKLGFRFAFSYFLLYIGPGAVGSLSSYQSAQEVEVNIWSRIWHPIVPWVGAHVLRLNGNFAEVPNGSGDQLYDYALIFCMVVAAIGITAVWSALDRKRRNYESLYQWLRLFMRLVAAWAMLGYGVKKLLGAQFPPPDLVRLTQPFGQASPMGMLWTFMGVSELYSFFGGFGETLGGVLLLFPRFATLGALVSGAMMTNVLMLNLGYDVPRKIFSIHLVLMCLFLLIPDFRRLGNVFIFNRATEPVPQVPLFDDKLLNRIALVAQVAFGAYVLWVAGGQSLRDVKSLRATLPEPIHGVWSVREFTEDGVLRQPLLTDTERWSRLIFDAPKLLTVFSMDGSPDRYYMELDERQTTAKLWNLKNPNHTAKLYLEFPKPREMRMEGQVDGHPVAVTMERIDTSDSERFPLMNKGLHWVNPSIDNR
jgi:uncharacterized membrane protein YphA (DoxX/SURF4 family)